MGLLRIFRSSRLNLSASRAAGRILGIILAVAKIAILAVCAFLVAEALLTR